MNKLLEVYSKGFFNTLKEGEVEAATITAQSLLENYSQEDLQDFFKNKTVIKEEKLKLADQKQALTLGMGSTSECRAKCNSIAEKVAKHYTYRS